MNRALASRVVTVVIIVVAVMLALLIVALEILFRLYVLLGVEAVIVGSFVGLLILIWKVWAPMNFLFTIIPEGMARIIVKAGAFDKVLIQWKGYVLDQDGNVVPGQEPWRPLGDLLGGLHFIGWPFRQVYVYRLRWTSVREDESEVPHDEVLDQVLLKDHQFLVKTADAEDSEMVPLTLKILLVMRVMNPYKAIFRVQDWIEMVFALMKPVFREYCGQHLWQEMTAQKQQMGAALLADLQATGVMARIADLYGVNLSWIGVKDVGAPPTYQEASTRQYMAERDRERTLVEADAAAQQTVIAAKAEATKIRALALAEARRVARAYASVQQFGDLGKLIRALEAAEKSPLAASLTVQAVPGLAEVLRGIFEKEVAGITPDELRRLRELLQQQPKP